tara:strand:- start:251 stop:904 length:654 start_codon:yes stop_codon:yes gene_type:complete
MRAGTCSPAQRPRPRSSRSAYFPLRFVHVDIQRTMLDKARLPPWKVAFFVITDVMYALSVMVFGLVFAISPLEGDKEMKQHTYFFLQLIFMSWIITAAQYVEAERVARRSWAFLAVFGVWSLLLPLFSLLNYADYDEKIKLDPLHKGPWTPPGVMPLLDYGWMVLIALPEGFLPVLPKLRMSTELLEEGDDGEGAAEKITGTYERASERERHAVSRS